MQIPFDREPYIQLLKDKGYSATLTALQNDLLKWEAETFEGPDGYQPQNWEELRKVRAFSREIWDMATLSEKPLL
ncbi:MAG TPA: hypothetical protein DCS07_02365 [Bdellovibrionales bacterium]|nr:MAG: hypothetical protein A2Z97_14095 [Bdellovibrionales bacterium GWB1_52_6]OFZ06491.1 MAG: hypothetical protein A2X97_16865 [Bdellovibrionales bacterium GWA1_52_35]OFZ33108.1 MAG: hypothetical protein A2070_10125 [Bdellovibrionales bacterium GWC1_52_8]HAR41469.1 hypothetical protein [Bdellovibrionales bacterium]HCM39495.1 hypothetical protein [Bdellovibrionales bacterium]